MAWHDPESEETERSEKLKRTANGQRRELERSHGMAWRDMARHDVAWHDRDEGILEESEEPEKLRGPSKCPNDAGQSRERRGMAWHHS